MWLGELYKSLKDVDDLIMGHNYGMAHDKIQHILERASEEQIIISVKIGEGGEGNYEEVNG